MERTTCTHPDRDVAALVCGNPLPCPYHTVSLDTTTEPPEIRVPVTRAPTLRPDQLRKLKDIAFILGMDAKVPATDNDN